MSAVWTHVDYYVHWFNLKHVQPQLWRLWFWFLDLHENKSCQTYFLCGCIFTIITVKANDFRSAYVYHVFSGINPFPPSKQTYMHAHRPCTLDGPPPEFVKRTPRKEMTTRSLCSHSSNVLNRPHCSYYHVEVNGAVTQPKCYIAIY